MKIFLKRINKNIHSLHSDEDILLFRVMSYIGKMRESINEK